MEYYLYSVTYQINFDFFGLVLGLLLVLFPVIYNSIHKSQSKRSYMMSPDFRSDITLNFYEGYVEMVTVSSKCAYRWGYIDSFEETAESFIIYTVPGKKQGIFVPKASLTHQDMVMLDRIFSYISGKYQKIYLKNFR